MERSGRGDDPYGPAGPAGPGEPGGVGSLGDLGQPGGPGDPRGIDKVGDLGDPGEPGGLPLPLLPGFREMALRRMAAERRRLVEELTGMRKAAGLS